MKFIKRISVLLIITITMSLFIGCAAKTTETIKIATKPMTEQFILSEMLALIIEENTDYKVEITKGIGGGTSNIHPAIVKGDFDLYPEYTSTGWEFVLKESPIKDEEELLNKLKEEYSTKFKLEWMGMYGFNNTYGLAIRKELADKYNIKTYSDLAKYSNEFTFGAEYDFFEREDGFKALSNMYGLQFKKTADMDIGLKYKAINAKEVDVMNIFTTDGQLSASDVVVLVDDKSFFPNYYCGTVVRSESLEKFKNLEKALMKMQNILTDSEMAKLNYEVETNNKDEKVVAKEFLKSKGIIK